MNKKMCVYLCSFSEKLKNAGADKEYIKYVTDIYEDVVERAERNKRQHFLRMHIILAVTLCLVIIGAVETAIHNWENAPVVVRSIILGVALLIAGVLAWMKSIKKSKKQSETWVRHRLHQMEIDNEIYGFYFGTNEYREKSAEEQLHLFQDRFLDVSIKNKDRFEANMKNFDK